MTRCRGCPGQSGVLGRLLLLLEHFLVGALHEELFRGLAFARLERLGQAQEEGCAALAGTLEQHGRQVEEALAGLSELVGQTHTTVLGIQSEQERQGQRVEEIYEAVMEMRRRPGAEVTPTPIPAREKRVFGEPPAQRFEATRICLRVAGGTAARNLCLLAQREVRLGKNRENDIVLRVLPSTPENDDLTSRISRTHAVVRLAADGVVWQNANCQNGTIVAGKVLPAGASCPLLPGTIVRPANVLSLKCHLCPSPAADEET
ncbi:MAG: FHA domain-containing protein [Planctomycetes bacterium]|nr:FHA domain-containing protein [Planctomycetota bacterium]